MSPLGLSGIASGMDTDTIISQLLAIERQPRNRLVLADTRAQQREAGLKDIATKLGAVRDAANALKGSTVWLNVQKTTSSDPARIGVSAEAGAAPGTRLLEVSQLARTAQHAFTYAPSLSTQTITVGAFSLTVDPESTAATVAAAINDREDAPFSAVVAAGKLVLTSRTSGAANDFSIEPTPLLGEVAAYARPGLDALYTLDGIAQPPRSSNVITDAILGVEVTLKATTTSPISITVSDPAPDTDGVKAKVNAFVTAYNSAIDHIRGKLGEKRVKDPTTTSEAGKGMFASDTMLSGVLSAMRSQIGNLAAFGISTGAAKAGTTFSPESVAGKLTLDDTKLTAALAAGDTGTLRTALDGLGQRLSDVITPVAGAQVTSALSGVTAQRKRVADEIARTDVRLASREQRLRAQFTAMESALAASQAAQSQLSSQLAGLAY
jgi:flagellar hook-associated protein 2